MPGNIVARVSLLIVLCAPALRAQAPVYARDPADTLRYRERMETEVRTAWRAGRGTMTQDARIALTFTRGDTARAWYERLEVEAKHGNFRSRLDAPGQEMRGAFTLVVGPTGRVRTVSVPTFPAPLDVEFDSVFAWQFVDFLPVLPPQPLRPGLEWTDSGTINPARGRFAHTTRYRVTRDTVVDGVSAVIVETESRLTVRRVGDQGEEYSLWTELEGTERGRFVFAPEPGLLLRRERRGTLRGAETSLLEGERPNSAWQTREYTRTIELLAAPRN
jgi:hypothetical protein